MQRYLAYRVMRGLVAIWLVSTAVFLGLRTIGDPILLMLELAHTFEDEQILREYWELDDPLYVQYAKFLRSAIQGDMGRSFKYRRPTLPIVLHRLPATLVLTMAGTTLGIVVGAALGVVAALRPNSFVDQIAILPALIGQCVPVFWLGIMLMMLFAVRLGWLPASGSGGIKHLILPAVCLSNYTMASVARLFRANMIDVMSQDYIRSARAKGLHELVVIARHAVKNAALPVITVIGLQFARLLGGSIVVETIFDWPGLGSLLFTAIVGRDFPMVQAATVIYGMTVVICNLLVDIIYAYIDPRIRYA